MDYINHGIEKAVQLRQEENYRESNCLLTALADRYPDSAIVNYQCAWSYDVLGLEAEAVPHYEKAIALGLSGADLEGALIGLGSTYRTLGEYGKSKQVFLKGIDSFPDNQAMKVFYSMALYNLQEHAEAMEVLLKCLAETSNDAHIQSYKKAIEFYSDKLDTVWQ